jgi:U5 small nuclear ribonucleoprotein component
VCFCALAAALHSFMLLAHTLARPNLKKTNHVLFASKLWGDSYFNASSRTFQQRPPACDASRSFVEFILEAIHNIITRALGEAAADVKHTMLKSKFF